MTLPRAAAAADSSWAGRATQLATFLVPGVALSLPSGYSWGPALLVLTALVFARRWWPLRWDGRAKVLAALFAAMGVLWALSFDGWALAQRSDQFYKYLLALAALGLVQWQAPQVRPLGWGLLAGALGAGAVAVVQCGWLDLSRANGFTNAIQFAGLAFVLTLGCCFGVMLLWRSLALWQRALGALCSLAGVVAVLLSDTRGAWIMAPLVLGLGAVLLWRCGLRRQVLAGLACLVVVVGALGLLRGADIERRYDLAMNEVSQYEQAGHANTSVGQRLAHWKLAWDMGWERPLTGWGMEGYRQEKARRAAAGSVDPFVLNFDHAHNELLDQFAKRGLVGVALMLLFYGVPIAIFWPTRRRMLACDHQPMDRQILFLRVLGVMLPVSYAGFGLTQVFFAHNSGHLFYVYLLVVLLGALMGREKALHARG
ncbi:MAG: O-antigen ligase family protein [Comamonas sp.]